MSLSRNYLSEIPTVPESLRALDISYNFLSDFPDTADSTSLKKLEFLYLECNLFDYFKLYKVLTDSILNKMDVFSYDPCNFDTLEELKLISHAWTNVKSPRTCLLWSVTTTIFRQPFPIAIAAIRTGINSSANYWKA